MKVRIESDGWMYEALISDEAAESSYGIPVMEFRRAKSTSERALADKDCESAILGLADVIPGDHRTAADLVRAKLARMDGLPPKGLEWLADCGPDFDSEWVRAACHAFLESKNLRAEMKKCEAKWDAAHGGPLPECRSAIKEE